MFATCPGRDETKCHDYRNYEDESYVNAQNQYNYLNNTYNKLKKLDEGSFKSLNGISEAKVKSIFKNAKAGDLLWRGLYVGKNKKHFRNGHIAMVIGIKKDDNGEVTNIYVGEAVYNSGNKLSRFDTEAFAKSTWVNTDKYATFLIKMDNVYNYYSDKFKKECKDSCPEGIKTGGNTYKYEEMFNPQFADAIKKHDTQS